MRTLVTGVLLLVCAFAFAGGGAEEEVEWIEQEGPVTVGIPSATDRPMYPDNPDSMLFWTEYLLGDMNAEVTFYPPGESGADTPMQLEVKAGTQPDIYMDYMGRVSEFANAKYAHDITPLVGQEVIDQYLPSYLALMNKDGVQYGLPETAWGSFMTVNITLLQRVGMDDLVAQLERTGRWTIDQFLEASRAVRTLGEDYYGYLMFSASTGGDYWYLGFLPGFGATLYENNLIALNSPEGIAAMEFYKAYADEGLCPPGAAALTFSEFITAYHTGKFLATAGGAGLADPNVGIKSVNAENSDYVFEGRLVSFPTAEGVDKAPIALGPDGAMIFNKGYITQDIVDVFTTITGYRAQIFRTTQDWRYPSLIELSDTHPDDPEYMAAMGVLQRDGVWDMGIGLKTYGPVRLLVPPMFQAIFTGELSVREAVTRFEYEGNRVLTAIEED